MKFNSVKRSMPKVLINIGALMDIPTGSIVTGKKGESIINGGLGQVTGIVGHGNNYKSTILHYMMLSAADKIMVGNETFMYTYDTEVNISFDRLDNLASKHKHLPANPTTNGEDTWVVTDKSQQPGNEWVNGIMNYTEEKAKNKKALVEFTAFRDPYTKGPLKLPLPTFAELDSASELEGESTVNMMNKDLEDSSTNTFAMKQGLFKMKFFAQLPRITNTSNTYMLMTAQIGEKINMETGPMAKYNQPTKKLQYLKNGDAIKGVSTKFFYLLNNAWYAHTAVVLKNQSTRLPEYPRNAEENAETDLNLVKLTQMRSKTGLSGYTLNIVVSQTEGILPTLTEFHYIKTENRFGLEGSLTNYHLVLYPEVNLSRTKIRSKIETDELLCRAINITSELSQLHKFHPELRDRGVLCTPKELYEDIKALGYDWNIILKTRGYWLVDNYTDKCVPFLSVVDLLKMRKGQYTPYFMDDKKQLKEKYKKSMEKQ